jgi:hypothetical protein
LAPDEARSGALRMLEDADHLAAAQQDRVEQLFRATITDENPNMNGEYLSKRALVTESRAYRSGFAQVLAAGQRGRVPMLTAEEVDAMRTLEQLETFEARAMGLVFGTTGGYGVPVTIDPTIVLTSQQSGTELVRISRVETITTDRWKGCLVGRVDLVVRRRSRRGQRRLASAAAAGGAGRNGPRLRALQHRNRPRFPVVCG